FIKAKHGRAKIHYIHPSLKDILKDTYGVILYQEQIMKIATNLAGFSMGEADVLRKGVGKKLAELINQMKDKFIAGCELNGIDNAKSEKIFSLITKFGEYGFNKSHSTAYAYIAYMTAYLKANYKEHFTAALLSSEMSNTDKLSKVMNEAKSGANACEILPPSVNESEERFAIVKTGAESRERLAIRTGLKAVKNVGEAAIDSILQNRIDKPFKDLSDFCLRVDTRKVNKRTIENLIKSGALDIGGESRKWMLDNLESVMEESVRKREKEDTGQADLFASFGEPLNYDNGKDDSYLINSGEKDDKKSILAFEKESLGFYLSGHPLDGYEEKIKLLGIKSVAGIVREYLNAAGKPAAESKYKMVGIINQLKVHKTRNNDKMASFILNDKNSNVEAVFFPKNFLKYEEILGTNQPVILTGRIDFSGLNTSGNTGDKGFVSEEATGEYAGDDDDKNYKSKEIASSACEDMSAGLSKHALDADENAGKSGYAAGYDDADLDIKVIGESVELLDAVRVRKQAMPEEEVCIIEINESEALFNGGEFKNLLLEIKNSLSDARGSSKVILRISGYNVALNGSLGVDKALLKSKNLPGYLNIL
ncbi:MAG: helix-hairpin-helix domain-containing protein, partial [bacterium]